MRLREKRLIENILTSKIRSIAMGLVEIFGEVVPTEEKILKAVTFLPIDNGVIKRGDLIGVVKVFVVGVSRKKKIEVPTVNIEILVY